MAESKTITDILVEMLKKHEFELTPTHTPPSEYESVEESEQQIRQLQLEEALEIIGEDEKVGKARWGYDWEERNVIRAELRKAFKDTLGEGEE